MAIYGRHEGDDGYGHHHQHHREYSPRDPWGASSVHRRSSVRSRRSRFDTRTSTGDNAAEPGAWRGMPEFRGDVLPTEVRACLFVWCGRAGTGRWIGVFAGLPAAPRPLSWVPPF